jgi:integrase
LGKPRVASITSDQVEDFMRSMSRGSASRTLGLLGAIFSCGVKRKLMTVNPVRGVEKPKETKRNRRLPEAEYQHLGAALKGGVISDIFLFLAVTGFRSGEARNLRWSELDLERSIVTLGDTKTGVSVRPLSNIAIEIIQRQSRTNEYVFDYGHGRPLNGLRTYWPRRRERQRRFRQLIPAFATLYRFVLHKILRGPSCAQLAQVAA